MASIVSWNVNGMRSILRYGFLDWIHAHRPEIVCLQETRITPEEVPEVLSKCEGYTSFWNPAVKKGYAGTGVLTRRPPKSVGNMGATDFDREGRLQVIEFDGFTILNGYWPNSQDQRARLEYKLAWCRAITRFANRLVRSGHNVILCGDFNIAHRPIDLARPKQNENSAGYYVEEREAMTRFLKNGYVDTFRHFEPDTAGAYSWWSYRAGARERNVGWRIDYHVVNEAFMPRVERAWIDCNVTGSDHCPVGIEVAA